MKKDTMTLQILRELRDADAPQMVRDVAKKLGKDPEADDLHPIRQVLNHLSRKGDGVARAKSFGSFRYYEAAENIDQAIGKRYYPEGYDTYLDNTGTAPTQEAAGE